MKFKQILAASLGALTVLSAFAGCGNGSGGESPSEAKSGGGESAPVSLKFLEPGTQPKDYALVAQKINDKLKADGTGIQVERQYISWDAWTQKTNLMIQTGDSFDLLPIMEDITPTAAYVANGGLSDITSAMEKEGSAITKNIPEAILGAAKFDGKLYTIPAYWREPTSFNVFTIRKDVLEKYNLKTPTTFDEIVQALKTAQSNWNGTKKLYLSVKSSYNPLNNKESDLFRTFDSYPFTVKNAFFYVDGNVKSWLETPEFKQICEMMRKAYTAGVINPDILTQTNDQLNSLMNSGNWFISFDTPTAFAGVKQNNPEAKNTDVAPFYLNPEKPRLRDFAFQNSVAVPSVSSHPDEAVRLINWIYSKEENYDLWYYGVEGTHYTKDGEHGMTQVLNPADNLPLYADGDWMSGNMVFERYDNKNGLPEVNKATYTPDTEAVDSIASGFNFDASKVQTEYVNMQTQAAQVITPLCMGVQDYGTSFESAISKMKAAGLDKVVAEYQRQFKEYLKSK